MKYKWKDKVRIKSKKELECISEVTDDMLKNGGAIMTIACLVDDADAYLMKEDGDFHFLWADEMIEGLVKEEIEFTEEDKYWCDIMSESDPTTYVLPQGYQFKDENGNVINATKIVLEKKYPKTNDIIKWLREHDMTKYISILYSGTCSIAFDTEKLIKDITEII